MVSQKSSTVAFLDLQEVNKAFLTEANKRRTKKGKSPQTGHKQNYKAGKKKNGTTFPFLHSILFAENKVECNKGKVSKTEYNLSTQFL